MWTALLERKALKLSSRLKILNHFLQTVLVKVKKKKSLYFESNAFRQRIKGNFRMK